MTKVQLQNCQLLQVYYTRRREIIYNYLNLDFKNMFNTSFQVALIIAQKRDKRSNRLSGIDLSSLNQALAKVYKVANARGGTVYLSYRVVCFFYLRIQK